jgi:hypothetical protein
MQQVDKLSTFVIFCDDVRSELGNKKSYMGVYTDELFVPSVPTLLPKFCVVTTISCLPTEIPKRLAVEFSLADDVLTRQEVSEDILSAWRDEAEGGGSEGNEPQAEYQEKSRLIVEFVVSPFTVPKEGLLEIQIETDTDRILAGSLEIVKKIGAHTTGRPIQEKPRSKA